VFHTLFTKLSVAGLLADHVLAMSLEPGPVVVPVRAAGGHDDLVGADLGNAPILALTGGVPQPRVHAGERGEHLPFRVEEVARVMELMGVSLRSVHPCSGTRRSVKSPGRPIDVDTKSRFMIRAP